MRNNILSIKPFYQFYGIDFHFHKKVVERFNKRFAKSSAVQQSNRV